MKTEAMIDLMTGLAGPVVLFQDTTARRGRRKKREIDAKA
jgi:hypothetical protein